METRERERATQARFSPPSAMTATEAEVCVTCDQPIDTPYCPHCGEKRASDRTYSLWEFVKDHVVEAVANFDGRVLRTLKTLVRKPGELTRAFMRGVRLPYLQPLQCFLLFNLGFFLWSAASNSRVFDTPLAVHVRGMPYSGFARKLVVELLRKTGENQEVYAGRFDAVASAQARSLVIVMVPLFALCLAAITYSRRRRRPMVHHLVFALHTYSWMFFQFVVGTYLVSWPLVFALRALHVDPGVYEYDGPISAVILLILGTYLALSLRRAYDFGKTRALISALLSVAAIAVIVQLYRGLLFFVTFYSM